MEFLKEYLNAPSPVGFEMELGGQKVWMEEANKFSDKVDSDNYGTAYAITGKLDSDYTVLLDAHADEISWLVSTIEKGGYLRAIRNGGTDHQTAPSSRVNLWGNNGKVVGVFGHPAIHIKERPEKVKLKDLFIDIGARTEKEVEEMGIEVGTVVTYVDGYMELGKNFISGRALDDKIGGYINIQVLKKLEENNIKLPYKLVVANTVQEEIGLKGAAMISNKIKPDVAFIIDVCHEDSSPAYKVKQFKGGDGTVLSVAPAVNNKLLRFVKETLKEKGVKYRMMASSGSTGTNTDSYAYPQGCPSVLFSLPLAYMHTTVETVHKDDITATVDAIYETLLKISEGQSFKY
jgi:putative aminopeptidase FrvX